MATRWPRSEGRWLLEGPAASDLIAGVSVGLVAIPQSLAYAELAGVPAHIGLYASALPSIAAAFFVSSKYLQTGPVALTAILSFGALSTIAEPFTAEYIGLASLLAVLVGIIRVGLGWLRLGRLSYLLSDPVLAGFTTGAAILIIASQLPKVLGANVGGRGVLADAMVALGEPQLWDLGALGFALATAALVVGGRQLSPIFPGVLLSVVAGVVFSRVLGFGGDTVGNLDAGVFPPLGLPGQLANVPALLVPAFAIALIGFAEPASIARTFAAADRLRWNADKEMVSQGVANLASGLSGGFPVGGSFSRSSLNRLAGARSAWAGAVTGSIVLLAIPLVGLLAALPSAVLGAVIIVAVFGLVKVAKIVELFRGSRPQALVAGGTLVATLAFAPRIEWGVVTGVALALAAHLYRELATLTVDAAAKDKTVRVMPKGVIWFATVPEVERRVRDQLAANPAVERVEFDLGGVGRLDYTAAASLGRLAGELSDSGVEVEVINVEPGAARAALIHLEPLIGSRTAVMAGARESDTRESDTEMADTEIADTEIADTEIADTEIEGAFNV